MLPSLYCIQLSCMLMLAGVVTLVWTRAASLVTVWSLAAASSQADLSLYTARTSQVGCGVQSNFKNPGCAAAYGGNLSEDQAAKTKVLLHTTPCVLPRHLPPQPVKTFPTRNQTLLLLLLLLLLQCMAAVCPRPMLPRSVASWTEPCERVHPSLD